MLHYRTIGCKEWKQIPFKHRIRAAFAVTVPAEEFSIQGMEYYITASDSRNVAMYPADAPARLHTIIVTGSGSNKLPSPVVRLTASNRLKWEKILMWICIGFIVVNLLILQRMLLPL